MARFRRSLRGRSKPIHPTKWCAPATGDIDITVANGTTTALDICSEAQAETMTSPTVLRIRGELSVGHSEQGTAQEVHMIHMGILVWPSGAFVTGVPNMSTTSGLEAPWMWLWSDFYGNLQESAIAFDSTGAVTSTTNIEFRQHIAHVSIDVKARRKIPSGSNLILVTQSVDFVGGADCIIRGTIRSLIQE